MAQIPLRAESVPANPIGRRKAIAALAVSQFVDRQAIEDQIEMLIAMLDNVDGDCDREEDDPSGGAIEDAPQDVEGYLAPIYGIDQTTGPINQAEANRAWQHRRDASAAMYARGWQQ